MLESHLLFLLGSLKFLKIKCWNFQFWNFIFRPNKHGNYISDMLSKSNRNPTPTRLVNQNPVWEIARWTLTIPSYHLCTPATTPNSTAATLHCNTVEHLNLLINIRHMVSTEDSLQWMHVQSITCNKAINLTYKWATSIRDHL